MQEPDSAGFEVSGTCFFDYNGNGIKNDHEPPLAGISVRIGDREAKTDSSGAYRLTGVPAGHHLVRIVAPPDLTYLSCSLKAFQSLQLPLELDVEGDVCRDLALMQGFLTLPFALGTEHILNSHNDLDHRVGHIRNWAGSSTPGVVFNNEDWRACAPNGSFDQHQGTDWAVPIGTPIRAMAPGVVIAVMDDPRNPKAIGLVHDTGIRKLVTEYGHNSVNQARVGEFVRRGQEIALSGADAGEGARTSPHIHFNLYEVPPELAEIGEIAKYVGSQPDPVVYPDGEWVKLVMDPYRDVSRVDSENFWTKDNDPQCPGF